MSEKLFKTRPHAHSGFVIFKLFGRTKVESKALQAKIAKMHKLAPTQLAKVRLCAAVVLELVEAGDTTGSQKTVEALKVSLGTNWSTTTAIQFMSGRQADVTAGYGLVEEQPDLYLAHLIAKDVCDSLALGRAIKPDNIDVAKLRALISKKMSAVSKLNKP